MTVAIKNYIFGQFFIAIHYIRPHEPTPAIPTICLLPTISLAVLPVLIVL
jgi:hypothetical protein